MTNDEPAPAVLDLDAIPNDESHTVGEVLDAARRIEEGLEVSDIDRAAVARFNAIVQRTMPALTSQHADTSVLIGAAMQGMRSWFGQVLSTVQTVGAALAPVLIEFGAALRDMPPRLEQAVADLARHGWYVDGQHDIKQLQTLQALINTGNTEQVDGLLMGYFERRLDGIEATLVAELPRREKILHAAFAAHRRGDYELSIPVLLIQADGACVDLTEHHFFQKTRGTQLPEVATHIAATQGSSRAMFLGPIHLELPINASEKARARIAAARGWTTWTELNRHQVLHGESVDYGTELNSLKAVSLLNYLVNFLPDAAQAVAQDEASEATS